MSVFVKQLFSGIHKMIELRSNTVSTSGGTGVEKNGEICKSVD